MAPEVLVPFRPFLMKGFGKVQKWARGVSTSLSKGYDEVDPKHLPIILAINYLGFITYNSQAGVQWKKPMCDSQGNSIEVGHSERAYISGYLPLPIHKKLWDVYVRELSFPPSDTFLMLTITQIHENKPLSSMERVPVTVRQVFSHANQSIENDAPTNKWFTVWNTGMEWDVEECMGRGATNVPWVQIDFIDMRWGHDALLPDGLFPFVLNLLHKVHQCLSG